MLAGGGGLPGDALGCPKGCGARGGGGDGGVGTRRAGGWGGRLKLFCFLMSDFLILLPEKEVNEVVATLEDTDDVANAPSKQRALLQTKFENLQLLVAFVRCPILLDAGTPHLSQQQMVWGLCMFGGRWGNQLASTGGGGGGSLLAFRRDPPPK